MSRQLRILIPGAVYHVTSRGNERKNIFRDDMDRNIYTTINGIVFLSVFAPDGQPAGGSRSKDGASGKRSIKSGKSGFNISG